MFVVIHVVKHSSISFPNLNPLWNPLHIKIKIVSLAWVFFFFAYRSWPSIGHGPHFKRSRFCHWDNRLGWLKCTFTCCLYMTYLIQVFFSYVSCSDWSHLRVMLYVKVAFNVSMLFSEYLVLLLFSELTWRNQKVHLHLLMVFQTTLFFLI